jgi:hypothetical protein
LREGKEGLDEGIAGGIGVWRCRLWFGLCCQLSEQDWHDIHLTLFFRLVTFCFRVLQVIVNMNGVKYRVEMAISIPIMQLYPDKPFAYWNVKESVSPRDSTADENAQSIRSHSDHTLLQTLKVSCLFDSVISEFNPRTKSLLSVLLQVGIWGGKVD